MNGQARVLREIIRLRLIAKLYYRFIFGRSAPLTRKISQLVDPWKPIPKETWEAEYRSGHWTYLESLKELPRYSVIAGYCHGLRNGGSILDVGCGEGILLERLDRSKCSEYLGIDISDVAIRRACRMADGKTRFLCADVQTFNPPGLFDVIVFNESLYYFANPVSVLKRYEQSLKEDGIMVVSTFIHERNKAILRMVQCDWRLLDETVVAGAQAAWIVSVFPRAASALPRS